MISQKELKTVMFLPPFLQEQEDVIALTTAIDNRIQALISRFEKLEILQNIEKGTLTDEEVELLLWERHVDYFDESLSKEQKILLIKNSILNHYKKGTKANLERVLKLIFGELTILEWFEYQGEPYKFKVVIMNEQPPQDVLVKLNKTVEEYKNCRSLFEGIMIQQSYTVNLYTCFAKNDIKYEVITCNS